VKAASRLVSFVPRMAGDALVAVGVILLWRTAPALWDEREVSPIALIGALFVLGGAVLVWRRATATARLMRVRSRTDGKFVELEQQLADKKVALRVDEDARAWIAEKGYDPKMGARPMARVIQNHIKKPLANELLFGTLVGGGSVRVHVEGDGLAFAIDGAKQPR